MEEEELMNEIHKIQASSNRSSRASNPNPPCIIHIFPFNSLDEGVMDTSSLQLTQIEDSKNNVFYIEDSSFTEDGDRVEMGSPRNQPLQLRSKKGKGNEDEGENEESSESDDEGINSKYI